MLLDLLEFWNFHIPIDIVMNVQRRCRNYDDNDKAKSFIPPHLKNLSPNIKYRDKDPVDAAHKLITFDA